MNLYFHVLEGILNNRIASLFISMLIGCYIGNISLFGLKVGNTVGTLMVSILVSNLGGNIDPRSESFLFSLFLFAIGYDSGENVSKLLNKKTIKYIILSLIVMFTALCCSILVAKVFNFSKGIIVGIAAGALTQSAIIQSANDTVSTLKNIDVHKYNTDVIVGFSVSYFFGLISAIIWCSTILEIIFKKNLKEESIRLKTNDHYNETIKNHNYPKNSVFILCLGIVLGTLLSFIEINIWYFKIKVGLTGCLLSGLLFGWINSKDNNSFAISYHSLKFLQDFCLTAFIASVGISSGRSVINGIFNNGTDLVLGSLIVSVIPLLTSSLIGFYVLKYKNISLLSSSIAGARTANTACGAILQKCENMAPMQAFTIPFLISSILLPFLGPLLVYLVV